MTFGYIEACKMVEEGERLRQVIKRQFKELFETSALDISQTNLDDCADVMDDAISDMVYIATRQERRTIEEYELAEGNDYHDQVRGDYMAGIGL